MNELLDELEDVQAMLDVLSSELEQPHSRICAETAQRLRAIIARFCEPAPIRADVNGNMIEYSGG